MGNSKQIASSTKSARAARKGGAAAKNSIKPKPARQGQRAATAPEGSGAKRNRRASSLCLSATAAHPSMSLSPRPAGCPHDPCGPDRTAPQRVRPRQRQARRRHHGLSDQQRSSGFKSVQSGLIPMASEDTTLEDEIARLRGLDLAGLQAAGARCSGGAPQRTCRSTSCCGSWPIGCRRRCTATWTRRASALSTGWPRPARTSPRRCRRQAPSGPAPCSCASGMGCSIA